MRRIGRRRGNQVEKKALDVLSYEARAAFHRCYSAVWCELLPQLQVHYELTDEALRFHRLWHLDHQVPAEETDAANFHGHIFGLHPAGANFIATQTGAEMMGEYLERPAESQAFEAMLHGLLIAAHDYAMRHDVSRVLRGKTHVSLDAHGAVAEEQSDETT